MRRTFVLTALLVLFGAAGPSVAQQPHRIQVVVMGTSHFGATSDTHQSLIDDLFSDRRQGELADVRARLAAFGPDRVFVEHEPSRQAHWDSVTAAYRQGVLPTGNDLRNEIFQIGVRLAVESGIAGVTCVDYQFPDTDSPAFPRAASEAAYDAYLTATYTALSDSMAKTNEAFFLLRHPPIDFQQDSLIRVLPLREYFLRLNRPEVLRSFDYADFNYWAFAYGEGEEYVGADFVVNYWLSRNAKIYQNILRHASLDDDRYLVLIGASHVQMLTNWFASHPYFEVVELEDVLG
jgi:Family of unknown function (DUF5694)